MTYWDRYEKIKADLATIDPEELRASNPPGMGDQLAAARGDADRLLATFGTAITAMQRKPAHAVQTPAGTMLDAAARVFAAMQDGDWFVCTHLRRVPAQPSVVALPVRRIACRSCFALVTAGPKGMPGEGDRCDLCGTRPTRYFFPVSFTLGTAVVVGDLCRACVDDLGGRPDDDD